MNQHEDERLRNGEVWKQTQFPNHERVVQWIGGKSADEWMLMATDGMPWGPISMIPAADRDGKMLYTAAEALDHLTRLRYEQTGKDIAGNVMRPN